MKDKITNKEVIQFLKDFEEYSETTILEEGKEKKEVVAIAKAKGINLKDNKDLAGFKTIYTFANKANKNRARLPKKALLRALPSMIGKPVDIDHKRRYVVGHYIDYRYKQKEDMVIAYGVFYKSNFGEEWEEAKKLFKAKKLSTSYEIWCPENKRRKLPDGTVELLQQEIAGGALLYTEEPAFEDAKVLEMAKRNLDKQPEDLVFAKKYKEDEIIMCNVPQTKTEVKVEETPTLSKIICSNCKEEFDYNNIGEIKCPKCFAILDKNGTMIYPPQIKDFKLICPSCHVDRWRIVTRTAKEAKLRCMNCAKEYKVNFVEENIDIKGLLDKFGFLQVGTIQCYQCKTIIPFSGISNSKQKNLKCSKCGLEFNFDVAYERYKKVRSIEEIKELLDNTKESSEKGGKDTMAKEKKVDKASEEKVETEVKDEGKAKAEEKIEVKEEPKGAKKDEKPEEAKPEAEAKPEVEVKQAEEPSEPKAEDAPKAEEPTVPEKAKEASEEATKEKAETATKVEEPKAKEKPAEEKVEEPKKEEAKEEKTEPTPAEEPKVEEKPTESRFEYEIEGLDEILEEIEPAELEESARMTTEQRKALPDNMFAVVVKVKGKKGTRKVRMYPINDKAHVRNALARLGQPRPQATLKRLGVSIEAVRRKILRRARQLKMTQLLERYKAGIRKIAKKYRELQKSMNEKIKFYMDNAKTVIERRKELGEFANELTDEQLLIDKDYEIATLKKKLAEKKEEEIETASEVAGDKTIDDGYYKSKRDEINKKAFLPKK